MSDGRTDFDIVVIGAGPAGCYAALTAATRGCKVAIFEEHGAVGWPRHDPGWLMESDFAESVIRVMGKALPWTRVREYNVCDSESGELIEKSTRGGYLVRRDLLEKEIAALAVKAGARLFLRTKVVNLQRDGDEVEEVETNSALIPRARAKIVICADGIASASYGFSVKEGLCESVKSHPGISCLLANADVSAGIIEHFLSSDPLLNYKTFFTHGNGLSFLGMPSVAAYHDLKNREDNAVSRKIQNACPIEVSAYARTSSGKYAAYFKRMVRDNIMFVGDASGGAGNIHGMIQGQLAGTVAASAIKDKDITEKRLTEYQHVVLDTLGKAPFVYFSAREDFGSFNNWFREVEESTKGIKAAELFQFQS
jgi:digeranylgeranylglycerophospholipid reductase